MPERTCAYCNAPFSSHLEQTRYCSNRCGQLGRPKPTKSCVLCGSTFVAKSGRATYCLTCSPRDRKRKAAAKLEQINCGRCGKAVVAFKATSRFCSHDCYLADRYPEYRPGRSQRQRRMDVRRDKRLPVFLGRRQAVEERVERAAAGQRGTKVFFGGACRGCSRIFTAVSHGGGPPRFCSIECKRREIRRRRRARERGATVESFDSAEVFERDGWRCQLCGRMTNRRRSAPHPKAPVLDHVVPLKYDGEHSRANTQCAHFECNSIKGERVFGAGEQLRLIG